MESCSKFEQKYVHDVYSKVALQFSKTRYYRWNCVENFLKLIPTKIPQKIIEIGCGNGKNLKTLDPKVHHIIATDVCSEFLDMIEPEYHPTYADNLNLPFRQNQFDFVLSVAVIHHFSSESRRMKAIDELLRITTIGGYILITVWGSKSFENSQFTLNPGSNFIPFKGHERYYYIYREGELEETLLYYKNSINIIEAGFDKGNFFCIIQKIK